MPEAQSGMGFEGTRPAEHFAAVKIAGMVPLEGLLDFRAGGMDQLTQVLQDSLRERRRLDDVSVDALIRSHVREFVCRGWRSEGEFLPAGTLFYANPAQKLRGIVGIFIIHSVGAGRKILEIGIMHPARIAVLFGDLSDYQDDDPIFSC